MSVQVGEAPAGSPPSGGRRSRSRRWSSLQLAVLLGALLSAAWAVTTPLGAVPDEPAHVIYAAGVVRGEVGSGPAGRTVRVPAAVAVSATTTCPAFRPTVTASCIPPVDAPDVLVATETSAAHYPPLYYALVGWPTWWGFGDATWLACRLLSVLVASGLLLVAASAWRRPPPVLAAGLLLAVTPMTAFLAGSINPNSMEIAAGVATVLGTAGVLARVRDGEALRRRDWAALAVPALALALARPGSWVLLLGLQAVLVLGLVPVARTRQLAGVGAVSGACTAAGLLTGQVFAAPTATDPSAASSVGGAVRTVLDAGGRWLLETVGLFGWRDHEVPLPLSLLWLVLVAALGALALVRGTGRQRLAVLALLVGAAVAAPAFAVLTVFPAGVGYQGRYAMALTQAVPVLAAVVVGDRLPTRLAALVPPVLLGLGLLALAGSWLRYAVGLPLPGAPIDVVRDVAWVPPAWPLLVLALPAAALVALRLQRRLAASVA